LPVAEAEMEANCIRRLPVHSHTTFRLREYTKGICGCNYLYLFMTLYKEKGSPAES
jgi:hypothetical protein